MPSAPFGSSEARSFRASPPPVDGCNPVSRIGRKRGASYRSGQAAWSLGEYYQAVAFNKELSAMMMGAFAIFRNVKRR